MPPMCIVCRTSKLKNANRTLFKFPHDVKKRAHWCELINRPDLYTSNRTLYICDQHFLNKYIIEGGDRFLLKSGAQPFLDSARKKDVHMKIDVSQEDDPNPLLSLDWNTHQVSILEKMSFLYKTEKYSDVTITCDGSFYPAHKFVLSACSEYFEKIFSFTESKHPIVVLTEFTQENIKMLLQYMYLGEVKVNQLELPSLLRAAKFLHIKGLFDFEVDERQNKRKLADECSPLKRRNIENIGTFVTIPINNSPIMSNTVNNTPIINVPVNNPPAVYTDVISSKLHQLLSAEITAPNTTSLPEETKRTKEIEHESVKNEDYDSDLNEDLSNADLKASYSVFIDESTKEVKLDSVKMENEKLSNLNLDSSHSVFIDEHVKTEFFDQENNPSVESIQEDPFIEKDDIHMQEQSSEKAECSLSIDKEELRNTSNDTSSIGTKSVASVKKKKTHQNHYKVHYCKFCNYKTNFKTSLSRHQFIHTGKSPHKCTLCPYTASQGWNLKRHMVIMHNSNE